MKRRTGKLWVALASALALGIAALWLTVDEANSGQTPRPAAPPPNEEAITVDGSTPIMIEMSEEEFERFTWKRNTLREELRLHLRFYERQPDTPLIHIKHPRGQEDLTALALYFHGFGPESNVISKCRDMWQYFPEIVEIDTSSCRFDTIPDAAVEQFMSLPHLRVIVLARNDSAMDISEKAIKLVSKHRELEELRFGNCRISEQEFAHLADLKTLKSVTLGECSSPRCFVTLAKLPHFREFLLVGGGRRKDDEAFARPIDEETRQAIISLNGRLRRFAAREHTFPSVHGSILGAFAQVNSLGILDLEGAVVRNVVFADVEALQHLANLRHFDGGSIHYAESVPPEDRKKADDILRRITRRVRARSQAEDDKRIEQLREAGLIPKR